jgi:hypothetical protein
VAGTHRQSILLRQISSDLKIRLKFCRESPIIAKVQNFTSGITVPKKRPFLKIYHSILIS